MEHDRAGPTPGTLSRVEMKNFMCHDHLVVELVRGMNFITGSNGSTTGWVAHVIGGKSAILSAISVCLGCRASATQRGTSLDSLIKEDCSQAEVYVTIDNGTAAFDAYRFEDYGTSITVERIIRRDAPHTVRIRNGSTGKIVETRKDELAAICDHHALLVDNPLVVLTQETSKKFLSNSNPRDLYTLQIDYEYIEDRIENMTLAIKHAEAGWPSKLARVRELESVMRDLEKYQDSAAVMQLLKRELAWALVREQESQAAHCEGEAKEVAQRAAEIRAAMSEKEQRLLKISIDKMALAKQQSAARELETSAKSAVRENELRARKAKSNLDRVQQEISIISSEISDARKRAAELDSSVSVHCDDHATEHSKLSLERAEIEGRILDGQAELEAVLADQSSARSTLQALTSGLNSMDQKQCETQNALSQLHAQKSRMETAQKSRLRSFGDKMAEIIRQVAEKGSSFHRPPVGPLGLYIEMRQGYEKWTMAMDSLVGRELDHFIVHDHHDLSVLQSVFQALLPAQCPGIIVTGFDKPLNFDASSASREVKKLHPEAVTALDILNISHECVRKTLIISNGIERIMLLDDRDSAISIMNAFPRHSAIDMALTPKLSQSISLKQSEQASLTEDIRVTKGRIEHADAELKAMLAKETKIRSSISSLRSNLKLIDDMQYVRDNPSVVRDEAERCKQKVDELVQQFKSIAERQVAANLVLQETNSELTASRTALADSEAHVAKIGHELDSLVSERREFEDDLLKCKASLDKALAATKDIGEKALSEHSRAEKMRADAGCLGPEVYSERTVQAIDLELVQVKTRLQESMKENVDPAQVKQELRSHKDSYARSKREVELGVELLTNMQGALNQRLKMICDFRQHISQSSNIDFIVLLSARGFSGSLDYNHVTKELNLFIRTDGTPVSKENTRDIRQLSGGEKSFGTACFLLSLWESMGSPIRCLDEFDVFMDAVNRRIVLEMLVEHARGNQLQFILITPIPLNDFLASNPDIHVVRLKDPLTSRS